MTAVLATHQNRVNNVLGKDNIAVNVFNIHLSLLVLWPKFQQQECLATLVNGRNKQSSLR